MRQPASEEGLRGVRIARTTIIVKARKKFFRPFLSRKNFFCKWSPEGPAWTMLAAGQVVGQA